MGEFFSILLDKSAIQISVRLTLLPYFDFLSFLNGKSLRSFLNLVYDNMSFKPTQRDCAMNMSLSDLTKIRKLPMAICAALFVAASHAQTAPPPTLGEETKGSPAIEESSAEIKTIPGKATPLAEDKKTEGKKNSVLGTSTVIESRRESGQVYSIELHHSNAPTQYIEETDSDGNIESQSNDLEETPNLPKWKLGSW